MYLLYSWMLVMVLLLAAPFWLLQMARHGKYRAGFAERLGRVPRRRLLPASGARTIWVHAVSVGEVLAVSRLVAEMRAAFPEHEIFISTTTAAGQKLARERFGEERVFYFPLDFAFAVRPYLAALRPELVVLAETEFWPNFLRRARQNGARIAVVNARISDRSLPGYRKWRVLWRAILEHVDLFLAQSDADAQRLVAIGAPAARIEVAGNLKHDVQAADAEAVTLLRAALRAVPREEIIVCGSTVEGEEAPVLDAFRDVLRVCPRAILVLAPRHPERFAAVARVLAASGLRWWQRSRLTEHETISGGVVLLDTIGELAAVYQLGAIAFVGGSLAPRGGHNLLEPAQHGAAVLTGPHTENFRAQAAAFEERGALRVVDAGQLGPAWVALIQDSAQIASLGARAREVYAAHAGATGRTLAALRGLLAAGAAPATSAAGNVRA